MTRTLEREAEAAKYLLATARRSIGRKVMGIIDERNRMGC